MDVSAIRRSFLGLAMLVAVLSKTSFAEVGGAAVDGIAALAPNSVGIPPEIDSLSVSVYNGNLYIWGHVTDPDSNAVGRPVYIWGTFTRTAIVDQNNNFGVIIELPGGSAGAVYAVTSDTQGNVSGMVSGEFGG